MAKKPTYEELEQRIKEIEEEAEEREGMLQVRKALLTTATFDGSTINSLHIGVVVYDSTGNCVAANDAIGNMIGASKDQVLQQNYHRLESWKKSGLYAVALSAIEDKEEKHHEIEVETTFGKVGNFACHLVPYRCWGRAAPSDGDGWHYRAKEIGTGIPDTL